MGNVCECLGESQKTPNKAPPTPENALLTASNQTSSKPLYTRLETMPVTSTKELPLRKELSGDQPPVKSQISSNRVQNFQSKRYLGKGSFGAVVLVQKKNSPCNKLFAMKVIDKSQIRQNNLLQSDVLQKVIVASKNDFLVNIIETFQNPKKIYIVMEYLEGGDLYYYMKKKPFTQELIRAVVPQVVEAISFLHSKDIIYRDLKPENILVTQEGHIKITDFGLSRMEIENMPTFTFVGNLEYMSPETSEGKRGYNKTVDLWSLGVLLYELRHNKTPFISDSQDQTRRKIMMQQYTFDQKCSPELKDLIQKLIVGDPNKRLSLEAVRRHSFFKGVVWQDVLERKNPAPLKEIMKEVNIKFKGAEENSTRVFINSAKEFSPGLKEFTYEEEISEKA